MMNQIADIRKYLKCISSSMSLSGRTSTENSPYFCLNRFTGHTYHLLQRLLSFLHFSFSNFTKMNCFSMLISSNSNMIHSVSDAIVCSSLNSKQLRRN